MEKKKEGGEEHRGGLTNNAFPKWLKLSLLFLSPPPLTWLPHSQFHYPLHKQAMRMTWCIYQKERTVKFQGKGNLHFPIPKNKVTGTPWRQAVGWTTDRFADQRRKPSLNSTRALFAIHPWVQFLHPKPNQEYSLVSNLSGQSSEWARWYRAGGNILKCLTPKGDKCPIRD